MPPRMRGLILGIVCLNVLYQVYSTHRWQQFTPTREDGPQPTRGQHLHETLHVLISPPPAPPPPIESTGAARAPARQSIVAASKTIHSSRAARLTIANETGEHPVYSETPAAALIRAQSPAVVPAAWQRRREASIAKYIMLHRAMLRGTRSGRAEDGIGGSVKRESATHAEVPSRGLLPRRFIVVRPCCQLCNRMRVLVSALALGILTDRAVLIDFDGSSSGATVGAQSDYYGRFDDLFDSPIAVQSRLPRDVEARGAVTGAGGDGLNAATGTGTRSLPWLTMMTDFMCTDPLSCTRADANGSP
jgi:hypothetical protein